MSLPLSIYPKSFPRPKGKALQWSLDTAHGWRMHKNQEQVDKLFRDDPRRRGTLIGRVVSAAYSEIRRAGLVDEVRNVRFFKFDPGPFREANFPWDVDGCMVWRDQWAFYNMNQAFETLKTYAPASDVSCRMFLGDITWDLLASLGGMNILSKAGEKILQRSVDFHSFASWTNIFTDSNEFLPEEFLPPRRDFSHL